MLGIQSVGWSHTFLQYRNAGFLGLGLGLGLADKDINIGAYFMVCHP